MKIAVTYENGQIFQHFGHTETFKIYNIENGKISSSEVIGTEGSGHSALADVLKNLDVNILICGGIGGCAISAMNEAGIKLYGGVSGDADKAVEELLSETLNFNENPKCNSHEGHHHEGGHHGGSCGRH